ncbi:hypothetical protein GCM10010270_09390 [Streptomyces violaceus]|nr:hypothetical protein GCM10010270_09390 [Streptomyces janthinus]
MEGPSCCAIRRRAGLTYAARTGEEHPVAQRTRLNTESEKRTGPANPTRQVSSALPLYRSTASRRRYTSAAPHAFLGVTRPSGRDRKRPSTQPPFTLSKGEPTGMMLTPRRG